MPKSKVATYPNTKTLLALVQEYQEMLREAELASKRILGLEPQSERFWDELTESAHLFTLVGSRSESIWEEIVKLVDQLPEE